MKLTGNTIFITGGSSGIGFELSKRFVAQKNKVIICGRSLQKLEEAKQKLPELEIYQCDIADKAQTQELVSSLKKEHPDLNLLINNAAIVHKTSFFETDEIMNMAEKEIATNLLAPIHLIHQLNGIIQKNSNPAIVNVTTGLIYTPRADYPFYNATKAALHSFTQVLRKQAEQTQLKIFEVMFPAVDTPWHNGNPPKIAISPKKAVDEMINGLDKGKLEIRIAGAKLLYKVSRWAPGFAFKKVNSLADD